MDGCCRLMSGRVGFYGRVVNLRYGVLDVGEVDRVGPI